MAFLKIDETKCKQDGICAADCPEESLPRRMIRVSLKLPRLMKLIVWHADIAWLFAPTVL
jgi:ferredoxin